MKYAIVLLLVFVNNLGIAQQQNNWENPSIVDENKEAPRASFMLYDNKASVIKDDYTASPYYLSLNGVWKFNYTAKYKDRPETFYQVNFNDAKWNPLNVPSNW